MIAEHKLDSNAENWFKLPWRNGWNAIDLALHVAQNETELEPWLSTVCRNRSTGQDVYWTAQDLLSTTVTPNRMMRAALRCLQILIANSDGGGEVYNAILLGPFSTILPERVNDLVMEYRCRDSIGVSAVLRGDGSDRLRRAFTIAWKRGLYHAAYSLPMAPPTSPLQVIK